MTTLSLLADNWKISRSVLSTGDCHMLYNKKLITIQQIDDNLLKQYPDEWKSMLEDRSLVVNSDIHVQADVNAFKKSNTEKDQGVIIDSDLSSSKH